MIYPYFSVAVIHILEQKNFGLIEIFIDVGHSVHNTLRK